MRNLLHSTLLAFLVLAGNLLVQSAQGADKVDFGREILPILSDNCFFCHGPDVKHREADLRLDLEASAKLVHDGRAAVVPGKAAASELVRRILSADADEQMPPPASNRKLTQGQIELLQRWIDEGGVWGGHWAFSPPRRLPVPLTGEGMERARGPIDAFLISRLQREGLTPAPEALRETLLRRITLDLTGLPPTLAEQQAFLADGSPDAYERQVDRLVATPAFGERMAWDWLDAARYADSNGYQGDGERTMYPWRDWLVGAINSDLPFDQFTIWQLAGDLLPDAAPEQKLATGFLRNHMINGEGGRIAEESRVDYVMDMAETTGTLWLGLTFNCCRCHDHKFDPLTNRDYYSLFAFFNQTPVDGGGGNPQSPPILEVVSREQSDRLAALEQSIPVAAKEIEESERLLFPREGNLSAGDSPAAEKLPEGVKAILKTAPGQRTGEQLSTLAKQFSQEKAEYGELLTRLRGQVEEKDGVRRSIPKVMVMADMPAPRKTFMLTKGLYDKPGGEVSAAVPAQLPPLPQEVAANRLALARWLVSADQPLTARVVVNRYWQQFFGLGLVKTAEDFGVQGERPKHPELLDWLAVDFRESGWGVKRLARKLLTSATYRQSSRVSPELWERDPENRLLARGPRYRLPSWMIRDQALAASGLGVERIGGMPVKSYQPAGVWEEATFGNKQYKPDSGAALYRRGIYTFWRRIVGPTMFFDTAARQTCTVKQFRTNTPLHALATLNDVTYVEASRHLAQRVLQEAKTPPERITLATRLILARSPSAKEQTILLATLDGFLAEYQKDTTSAGRLLKVGEFPRDESLDPAEHAAWTALVGAIFNLDEALTKE